VHRFAVQPVFAAHGRAAPRQKGRHQKAGVHPRALPAQRRGQLLLDHLQLQWKVTAQGRITAADQHQGLQPGRQIRVLVRDLGQHLPERGADRAQMLAGRPGLEGAAVDQHKQQRRWIGQALAQGGRIGLQQQRAAVHRLRAGGQERH